MKWNDCYVAGVGTCLPPPVSTGEMVAEGILSATRNDALGYESVLVETERAAPDMAVVAARSAIARSGVDPAGIGLVVHSSLWFQGRHLWPSASYVAAQAVSASVPALDMQQQCNAGLGSIELAASHLAAGTRGSAVLLTTGDRFDAPAIDRWNTHGTSIYADGGTAMVVSAVTGFARILVTTTTADNFFEGMNRGTRPLDTVPPPLEKPLSLAGINAEFAAAHDTAAIYGRLFGAIQDARRAALDEIGLTITDIAKVVDIHSRGGVDDRQYGQFFGIAATQSTWDYGKRVGHLGTGDHFACLAQLIETGGVKPGDLVMLFGGGGGYTATTVILEILEVPVW